MDMGGGHALTRLPEPVDKHPGPRPDTLCLQRWLRSRGAGIKTKEGNWHVEIM